MRALLLSLLLCPAGARAAMDYARFSPPNAGFTLEYPSDWKRQPGLKTVRLRPAGRDGADVRVLVELRPLDKSEPATAKGYEASLSEQQAVKKIEKASDVDVDGRKGRRLSLLETAELKDRYGQKMPGPLKETHVIVPLKKGYLVARIEGIGAAYDRALPEFDRLVSKLALEPSPKAKTKK